MKQNGKDKETRSGRGTQFWELGLTQTESLSTFECVAYFCSICHVDGFEI